MHFGATKNTPAQVAVCLCGPKVHLTIVYSNVCNIIYMYPLFCLLTRLAQNDILTVQLYNAVCT
jgi:hypothetical protein